VLLFLYAFTLKIGLLILAPTLIALLKNDDVLPMEPEKGATTLVSYITTEEKLIWSLKRE
jgi:hypothetical protein